MSNHNQLIKKQQQMKILTLMVIMSLSIVSCSIPKEESVENYMKAHLATPESYELVNLELIDTVSHWQVFRIEIEYYEKLFTEQRNELNSLYSLHGKYSNKAQSSKLQFEETQATLLDIHNEYKKMKDKLNEDGGEIFKLTYNSRNEHGDLVEDSKIVVLKNNSKHEVFRDYNSVNESPNMLKSIIENELHAIPIGNKVNSKKKSKKVITKETVDGKYTYSERNFSIEYTISGNKYYSKSILSMGPGYGEHIEYYNGIVKGNYIYDSSGLVELGFIRGKKLVVPISGKRVELTKN